jgi:hypothetical protein
MKILSTEAQNVDQQYPDLFPPAILHLLWHALYMF